MNEGLGMLDLSKIRLCAFDLDGTLYQYSDKNLEAIRFGQALGAYALMGGTLTIQESYRICTDAYHKTGASNTYLKDRYGLTEAFLHEALHERISVADIEPVPGLRQAFINARNTGIGIAIATHSHENVARRALTKLAVFELLMPELIVTVEKANFDYKHYGFGMFEKVIQLSGIAPEEILFLEDTFANLEMAKKIGMKTGYIHWNKPFEMKDYIDAVFETPVQPLNAIALRPTPRSRSLVAMPQAA